jgi:hypothetical protein
MVEFTMFRRDPILHTHVEDTLDDAHPLAWTTIYCDDCSEMIHAGNNECMDAWVETGKGNFCLSCFAKRYATDDDVDGYGLPHPTTSPTS